LDNNAMIEFRKACHDAHIGDFHFHDLRHTFATHFLRTTKNLYMLQSLLGHSSISMTQRYAHVIDEDRIKAMASFDKAIGF
jgi:site-specific recombinase XerD